MDQLDAAWLIYLVSGAKIAAASIIFWGVAKIISPFD